MGEFAAQGMPEESKLMASIIFCKIEPCIWKVYRDLALVKSPGLAGELAMPGSQVAYNFAGYSSFFLQFSNSGGVCCFARLYAAFDQLETGLGVFECQYFQRLSGSKDYGARFDDDHWVLSSTFLRPSENHRATEYLKASSLATGLSQAASQPFTKPSSARSPPAMTTRRWPMLKSRRATA